MAGAALGGLEREEKRREGVPLLLRLPASVAVRVGGQAARPIKIYYDRHGNELFPIAVISCKKEAWEARRNKPRLPPGTACLAGTGACRAGLPARQE